MPRTISRTWACSRCANTITDQMPVIIRDEDGGGIVEIVHDGCLFAEEWALLPHLFANANAWGECHLCGMLLNSRAHADGTIFEDGGPEGERRAMWGDR